MKLFKNVDIKDLKSIMEKGILSLDESGNNNWQDGKRTDNRTDRIYLFQPIEGRPNSFPQSYGVALIEVDIDGAELQEMTEQDVHADDYIEYISEAIPAEQIKAIYIPSIFKAQAGSYTSDDMPIVWCDMEATVYNDDGRIAASAEELEEFAKTAKIVDSSAYNFFRGTNQSTREIVDLYDINYIF